jgi:enterochelin esterase family protein
MAASTAPEIESARLRKFTEQLADGTDTAVAALSADLTDAGGPLVEPLPDDEFLVTFVYIGEGETVAVDSHLILNEAGERRGMRRVPGTDVWFLSVRVEDDRLQVAYRFLVDSPTALLSVGEVEEMVQFDEAMRRYAVERHIASRHDPFNRERLPLDGARSFANDPDMLELIASQGELMRWESVLRLAGAQADKEIADLLAGAPGDLTTHRLPRGVFGDEREVTVYTPPGAADSRVRHSLLLVLDGPGPIAIGLPQMITSLIERGELSPTIVAFVHNKDMNSRSVEMICNADLPVQYAEEIVPWLRERYPVTDNPARTAVAGGSYGGLGSSWLAYSRPDVFGNVLSLSGSYWWGMRRSWGAAKDSGVYGFDDEPEWLTRQFAATERKPIRFWIGAGTLERQYLPGGVTLLSANRNFRSVLRAAGYDVTYHEFHGGHDRVGWQAAFVHGLRHLFPGTSH